MIYVSQLWQCQLVIKQFLGVVINTIMLLLLNVSGNENDMK